MAKKINILLVVTVIVGILAAAHLAFWNRYQVEKDFKQTEIVMTYQDIEEISAWESMSTTEAMQRLEEYGLTTVLFKEPTVEDLGDQGMAFPGAELKWFDNPQITQFKSINEIDSNYTYLLFEDENTYKRVKSQLEAKLDLALNIHHLTDAYLIEIPLAYNILIGKDIGVGFDTNNIQQVEKAGLNTMVQVRSWSGVSKSTPEDLEAVFNPLNNIPNLSAILFNDQNVPGYKEGLLPVTAEQIRETGAAVAKVEFLPQMGLTNMGLLLDKNIIRLHSIPEDEMGRYTPGPAIDRYALAAAERNHRALLVRTFAPISLESQQLYLGNLKAELEKEGLKVGDASKLPAIPVSKAVNLLIGIGVIGGGVLLLNRLGFSRWALPIFAVSVVAWTGLLYLQPVLARKVMALASVIVFPTLSILIFTDSKGASLGQAIKRLVAMSFLSLVGALFMVGLLADASFMLKLDQFAGVKLAHVVPLGIVGAVFIYQGETGKDLKEKISNMMNRPILWGYALLAGLLLLAVAIYVSRTGNDGVAVSQIELQVRTMLDQLLGVRPRTKEFLLGHPAMLVLLYFGYRNNSFLPLLILGVIAQVSLVNTFAHIHTPLLVSIIRFGNGLWLGILLGIVAILVYKVAERGMRRYLHG